MKIILDIPRPIGVKHIFWEHAMKSVFAFLGMFALLFFGPLLLEGKTNRHSQSNDDLPIQFLFYMIEHPEIQYLLCFLAVLVMNLHIIYKNSRKNFIVKIEVNDTQVKFSKASLYYRKIEEQKIKTTQLEFLIKTKTSDADEKKQTLQFINKSNGRIIGIIKPSHHLWNDQLIQIRTALYTLKNLGISKKNTISNYTSVLGSLFNR